MGNRIFIERGVDMISNRIEIDFRSSNGRFSNSYGYREVDTKFINYVKTNLNIKYIQISKNLPPDALEVIDSILSVRPDLIFRIYGMRENIPFDLTNITCMKNIRRLQIDILEKKNYSRFENLSSISYICSIEELILDIWGNADLSFLGELKNLKRLMIYIESGTPNLCFEMLKNMCLDMLGVGGKAIDLIKKNTSLSIKRLVIIQGKLVGDIDFDGYNELIFVKCNLDMLTTKSNYTVNKIFFIDSKYKKRFINSFEVLSACNEIDSIYKIDISNVHLL